MTFDICLQTDSIDDTDDNVLDLDLTQLGYTNLVRQLVELDEMEEKQFDPDPSEEEQEWLDDQVMIDYDKVSKNITPNDVALFLPNAAKHKSGPEWVRGEFLWHWNRAKYNENKSINQNKEFIKAFYWFYNDYWFNESEKRIIEINLRNYESRREFLGFIAFYGLISAMKAFRKKLPC